MNLSKQFDSLGNNIGEHNSDSAPMAQTVGTPDAAQGQYMGKHRTPKEQWNPAGGNGGWDEDQYQRTWGQNDMTQEPNIQPVQFTGGLGNRRPVD